MTNFVFNDSWKQKTDQSNRHQNGRVNLAVIVGPLTSAGENNHRRACSCVCALPVTLLGRDPQGHDVKAEDGCCRYGSADHPSAPSGHYPPFRSSSDSSLRSVYLLHQERSPHIDLWCPSPPHTSPQLPSAPHTSPHLPSPDMSVMRFITTGTCTCFIQDSALF